MNIGPEIIKLPNLLSKIYSMSDRGWTPHINARFHTIVNHYQKPVDLYWGANEPHEWRRVNPEPTLIPEQVWSNGYVVSSHVDGRWLAGMV